MKRSFYTCVFILLILASSTKTKAQDGFSEILKAAPGDATLLLNAYANPLFRGLGTGINNGWTNTAKTHGLLHFELRVSASVLTAPSSDKSFDVTKLGLSNNVRLAAGSPAIAPTFIGSDIANTPTLELYGRSPLGTDVVVETFKLPKRQIPAAYAPQLQLTVGLVKNTDVTLRVIPRTKVSDDIGSAGMFGFGVKHEIMPDILGDAGSAAIPFNLAIAAGYTRLSYKNELEVRPAAGKVPEPNSATRTDFSTQRLDGKVSGVNVQAIVSKKIMFFTPFAAIGYNTAQTNVGLLGNYPVTSGQTTYTVYTDPVKLSNNINNFKFDAGFQLDLSVLKIYASGSLGTYKSVTGGIGLGF